LAKDRFDLSKVPDIYDCIKYDRDHNNVNLKLKNVDELYEIAQALADCIIPLEYGITSDEKRLISLGYCTPLLRKIRCDLQHTNEESQTDPDNNNTYRLDQKSARQKGVLSPGRHVRTRLYFTSESHIHSLVNLLRYGGLEDFGEKSEGVQEQWNRAMEFIGQVPELNYLTQIVIMLYEDPNQPVDSKERFHIELHFSPGEKINKEYNISDDDTDSEDELDEKHNNPDSEATTIRENSEHQIQENTILFEKSTEKSSIDPMEPKEPDRDGHYSSKGVEFPGASKSNLEDGSTMNFESESFLNPINNSRLEKFMKSAQMHKSAPPGSGNSGKEVNGVGFTVGTPPVESIHEVEDTGNNLERVYSGKSDNSNQRAFDWNQLVGLGTADGNPMFSHKIINGETYETEELMNLTKPNVTKPIPRTHSAGKLSEYNSRGTVSAPDISFKNQNNDMETAKNIITDYSMVTSIAPLETLHNSLTLEQMDAFLGKMIESDKLGGNAGSAV